MNPLSVRCPLCDAKVSEPCYTAAGNLAGAPHAVRCKAAKATQDTLGLTVPAKLPAIPKAAPFYDVPMNVPVHASYEADEDFGVDIFTARYTQDQAMPEVFAVERCPTTTTTHDWRATGVHVACERCGRTRVKACLHVWRAINFLVRQEYPDEDDDGVCEEEGEDCKGPVYRREYYDSELCDAHFTRYFYDDIRDDIMEEMEAKGELRDGGPDVEPDEHGIAKWRIE